jgi:hypothetical protein
VAAVLAAVLVVAMGLSALAVLPLPAGAQPTPEASAAAAIAHLRAVMDHYHDRIPVYDDVSSAGNRFHVYAKIPDPGAAVAMNGSSIDGPRSGATAIRAVFTGSGCCSPAASSSDPPPDRPHPAR